MSDETSAPGRDAKGRLLPGHGLGGRPRGRRNHAPIATALEAVNLDMDAARKLLVGSTIAALDAKDATERSAARKLLASLLFPRSRSLDAPDLFRGCRTPQDMLAAVTGGVAAGALAPDEGADLVKLVEALAESGQWEDLRRLHDQAMRESAALPVGPDAGPGGAK